MRWIHEHVWSRQAENWTYYVDASNDVAFIRHCCLSCLHWKCFQSLRAHFDFVMLMFAWIALSSLFKFLSQIKAEMKLPIWVRTSCYFWERIFPCFSKNRWAWRGIIENPARSKNKIKFTIIIPGCIEVKYITVIYCLPNFNNGCFLWVL